MSTYEIRIGMAVFLVTLAPHGDGSGFAFSAPGLPYRVEGTASGKLMALAKARKIIEREEKKIDDAVNERISQ